MPDTSEVNLKCSIYPMRDFSTTNFIYGYSVANSPIDNDSDYIPQNEQLFNNIIMGGLRPYRTFFDIKNIDLVEAFKSISNLSDVNITAATVVDTARRNVSLVKQDRILQENYYDCDNPVFDDIPISSFPILKYDDDKFEDINYFTIWQQLTINDGSNYLDVTIDDGGGGVTYRFKYKPASYTTTLFDGTVLTWSYDVEATTSDTETNKSKTAKETIKIAIKKGFLEQGQTPTDILGEKEKLKYTTKKISFGFTTKHQTYSDLIQFQSLTLGDKFGVLIYEDGDTVTREITTGIGDIEIADFDNVLFKGYCQISGLNEETNEVNWSGYWYQTPLVADFMNYIKAINVISNSTFDSDITGWSASGAAGVAHDSTNDRLQITGLKTATTDYVTGTTEPSPFFLEAGIQGIEFEVFNFVEHDTVPATVMCRLALSSGDSFDVQVTGNGKYSYINEGGVTDDSSGVMYFETTGTGTTATSFDIDNVYAWQLG